MQAGRQAGRQAGIGGEAFSADAATSAFRCEDQCSERERKIRRLLSTVVRVRQAWLQEAGR